MTTLKIATDLFSKPPKTSQDGQTVTDYRSIAMATTDLVTTQIIALGVLPAGHRAVGFALECTDMDSSSGLTITVGILNAFYNGVQTDNGIVESATPYLMNDSVNYVPSLVSGMNFITASTIGASGGRAPSVLAFSHAIGVNDKYDRIIAVSIAAAPGGAVAGTLAILVSQSED